MSAIPADHVPEALVLRGRGPEIPAEDGLSIDVFVNDSYVESAYMRGDAVLHGERVPLSPALLERDNRVRVEIQRTSADDACAERPRSTFQLAGGTRVAVELGDRNPSALREWAVRRGEPLEIVVPRQPGKLAAVLPALARILARAAPRGVDLRVKHERPADGGGPFIHVASTPGSRYDDPPISLSDGLVRIETGGGAPLRFRPGRRHAVVQLVERGGASGIWIAPGDFPLPRDAAAVDGNAALLDGSGPPVAFDTADPGTVVRYPGRAGAAGLLATYRAPIAALAWLGITAAVAAAVVRKRRRSAARSRGDDTDGGDADAGGADDTADETKTSRAPNDRHKEVS